MEFSLFLTSASLFLFAMSITPGPNNAVLMAVGLSRGVRAAGPHILAVTVGAPLLLLLVGLGLDTVFTGYPILHTLLQYAGTLYILWLAWAISGLGQRRSATSRPPASHGAQRADAAALSADPAQNQTEYGAKPLTFMQGLAFQLVNVKGWLSQIVAVSTYAGASDDRLLRVWIMCGLLCFFVFISTLLWAAGGAFMRQFLTSEGVKRCNYLFALFLIFSIVLLFI